MLPATFERHDALELAVVLATRTRAWELCPNHGPCPSCGRPIGSNDLDFLYNAPGGWQAACLTVAGGCGFTARGASRAEALFRWGSPHHQHTEPL